MPRIRKLVEETGGRIYVHLSDERTCTQFLKDAEAEGFTFCDGALPTSRHHADLYALNPGRTLNFVGFVGHAAYACAKKIGNQPLFRVEYNEYLEG